MAATTGATKTFQFRDFSKGMNQTSARTAIRDDEMWFLENAQPIGAGQLQILAPAGTAVATINAGIAKMFGVTMKIAGSEVARIITVNNDGSMSSIDPVNKVTTAVCGSGTVTTSARVTMWQDTPLLIGDPTKGYFNWDGTTFSGPIAAPAPSSVTDLATFEGRACLLSATRAITLSAPASYNGFNTIDGALTFSITDSVFAGSIKRLLSALEVLWVIGPNAVNAVSNIQISGSTTTYQNTNVVASVGTLLPSSVTSFFRTFLFLTPYGVYAIVGATPQKLSEQLDGLFPNLSFGTDQPAGVFVSNRVFVWCVLVTYTDPATNVARPVLLCFSRNAWFIASQGNSLAWVASLVNLTTGNPELYGTDGTTVFKCFGGTTAGTYTIQTKFYDLGAFTQRKQLLRVSLELQNLPANVNLTATSINELGQQVAVPLQSATVTITFVGTATITFTGSGGNPITWVISSFDYRSYANLSGDYFGLNITGTSLPFTLSGIAYEVKLLGEWT